MFDIELVEMLFSALSFMSVVLSVYLWRRAVTVPTSPDLISPLTLSWRSSLNAQAGFASAFAIFPATAHVINITSSITLSAFSLWRSDNDAVGELAHSVDRFLRKT